MKNIKTQDKLNKAVDEWYNRIQSLREYSENKSKPLCKRHQARNLFDIMLKRIMAIARYYVGMAQPKMPLDIESGGFINEGEEFKLKS